MTGDLVKAMRACPHHHRRHRRRVRRRRRHDGAGLRHAPGHGGGQDRFCSPASAWPAPTWAPRAAAAHDRPGPGSRAALHRPRDEAQEGLAWGFFNALHDSGELLAKAQELARSWPRARPSATP
jgi:hypothetical protein